TTSDTDNAAILIGKARYMEYGFDRSFIIMAGAALLTLMLIVFFAHRRYCFDSKRNGELANIACCETCGMIPVEDGGYCRNCGSFLSDIKPSKLTNSIVLLDAFKRCGTCGKLLVHNSCMECDEDPHAGIGLFSFFRRNVRTKIGSLLKGLAVLVFISLLLIYPSAQSITDSANGVLTARSDVSAPVNEISDDSTLVANEAWQAKLQDGISNANKERQTFFVAPSTNLNEASVRRLGAYLDLFYQQAQAEAEIWSLVPELDAPSNESSHAFEDAKRSWNEANIDLLVIAVEDTPSSSRWAYDSAIEDGVRYWAAKIHGIRVIALLFGLLGIVGFTAYFVDKKRRLIHPQNRSVLFTSQTPKESQTYLKAPWQFSWRNLFVWLTAITLVISTASIYPSLKASYAIYKGGETSTAYPKVDDNTNKESYNIYTELHWLVKYIGQCAFLPEDTADTTVEAAERVGRIRQYLADWKTQREQAKRKTDNNTSYEKYVMSPIEVSIDELETVLAPLQEDLEAGNIEVARQNTNEIAWSVHVLRWQAELGARRSILSEIEMIVKKIA
ncbi:MAG: hypothetical protein IKZ87_07550, partial [Actinomycetaceae bacterium]|nr:hypothetical protein [Actinomycetaceae bacterium]